jgi:ubiquinone/menaquinone biosynthesis C-methylase UbiE
MNLYDKYILPKAIDWACNHQPFNKQREKIVPLAKGKVLEIGIGSGLNLPFYGNEVDYLLGIDPAEEVWQQNKIDPNQLPFAFDFQKAFAENIPAENKSFDAVVITYTMCSIPKTNEAFEEIRRVLKPNGLLLFSEHGKAPDLVVQKLQEIINPLWGKFGGGCHLNKDIPNLIKQNGFEFKTLNSSYIPGWKPFSFNYWGVAKVK